MYHLQPKKDESLHPPCIHFCLSCDCWRRHFPPNKTLLETFSASRKQGSSFHLVWTWIRSQTFCNSSRSSSVPEITRHQRTLLSCNFLYLRLTWNLSFNAGISWSIVCFTAWYPRFFFSQQLVLSHLWHQRMFQCVNWVRLFDEVDCSACPTSSCTFTASMWTQAGKGGKGGKGGVPVIVALCHCSCC